MVWNGLLSGFNSQHSHSSLQPFVAPVVVKRQEQAVSGKDSEDG